LVAARLIVLVGFPGVQGLDLAGPMDVFAGAQELVERTGRSDRGYRVRVASLDGEPFRTRAGLSVLPDSALAAVPGPIDTLVVPGGDAVAVTLDRPLVDWLRRRAPRARRVASVCTGAFLLAEAGLLDGRHATTHWSQCRALARRYPTVTVEPDPIYVRDGNRYTSAGVSAGVDLALALVEEDLGREAALTVARWLVLFLRRPGNQAQFSNQLAAQLADRSPIRELQHWLNDHLDADLSVPALAARARMSPRHFARSFQQQVGVTPGQYVQRLRLEAARHRLEDSDAAVEQVAAGCGFGSAETMRRSFVDALGVAPAEYRRRFRTATPAASVPSPEPS
jgi:transcriptional regulator GlxA family with amidase domain